MRLCPRVPVTNPPSCPRTRARARTRPCARACGVCASACVRGAAPALGRMVHWWVQVRACGGGPRGVCARGALPRVLGAGLTCTCVCSVRLGVRVWYVLVWRRVYTWSVCRCVCGTHVCWGWGYVRSCVSSVRQRMCVCSGRPGVRVWFAPGRARGGVCASASSSSPACRPMGGWNDARCGTGMMPGVGPDRGPVRDRNEAWCMAW